MRVGFDAKRIFHNKTGLGNYSRDIVRVLSTYFSDYKYVLFTPKNSTVDRLKITSNMQVVKPSKKLDVLFSSFWRQKRVVNDLIKHQIDIYHGLSNEIPRGIHVSSLKSVVTIHDLIFIRFPNLYSYIDQKIHLRKVKYAVNYADLIIAISEQTKEDIISYLKIPEEKIRVVYQGCHSVFKEEISSDFCKQVVGKYQLPEKYILNVGTIEERKNILTLVKALKNNHKNLVVIGKKTKYFQKISDFIKAHHMESRVFFLEGLTMPELAAIYKSASLFVYPSLFEGFGIPIVEALYSKIPVITSKGGCFAEAGGEKTEYINPKDELELSRKIEEILNDNYKRKMMTDEGFKYVQRFNDEVIAKEMMAVYQKL